MAVDARKIILHDPSLAREVYEVYAGLVGRKRSKAMYGRWIRRYVKPLARVLERHGILFVDPWEPRGMRALAVKLPAGLYEALETLSKELGVSKGAVIRFALFLLFDALSSLNEDGGGSDGG